jgi:acetyl-CoA synthetase
VETGLLDRPESYQAQRDAFRWALPQRYNIGLACADAWAAIDPERPALIRHGGAAPATITYGALKSASDRLALALRRRGVGRGDRVALILPQSAETVVTHLAAYKLGAVAVPLAVLFGAEALGHRLRASGARAAVVNAAGLERLAALAGTLPARESVLCVDGAAAGADGLAEALAAETGAFRAAETGPDDPALMIFTSGTTGPPKGALHGHRVLLGHLPGMRFSHPGLGRSDDRLWTPADWAWAGGLLNLLLPGLSLGVPVVFGAFERFDPERAVRLMAETAVRSAFLPPTALRMMRAAGQLDVARLGLRSVSAAGESLGRDTYEWARRDLGIVVNEFYGQTECNYVLGASAALGVSRAGAIGKPIPGHDVRVIDAEHRAAPVGEIGQIAIRRPDPVMFLGYWNEPEATRRKFAGDWLLTGDQGVRDADGYVSFVGRDDDVIISAGYRIGPSEVEDCIGGHPAVAAAAAVGKPDALRTEIVKAYVVLRDGYAPSEALAEEIRRFVRTRLSAAEYPREVAFVADIPQTTSGKVIRRHFREAARREAEAAGYRPAG